MTPDADEYNYNNNNNAAMDIGNHAGTNLKSTTSVD